MSYSLCDRWTPENWKKRDRKSIEQTLALLAAKVLNELRMEKKRLACVLLSPKNEYVSQIVYG